jgi:hypothetical protein
MNESKQDQHRPVLVEDCFYTLREPAPSDGDHVDSENETLRPNKTIPWQTILEQTEGEHGPTPTSDLKFVVFSTRYF